MTNIAVSIFKGKGIIFNRKKEFILGLWEDICNRLSKTCADLLSSYREKINEIFEDMKKTNILDLSPLESLLDSLFELAVSYDQERSNMADKTSEDEKLELISKAKECLESFKLEASEKIKKVSSSEKKLKRGVKKLQTLQQERENLEGVMEATQKEVEEIQAKGLAAETKVSSYDNLNLLTDEDSAHLEEKKKNLETSCQELINYKFCLD
uniref:Myosin-1-like n=1 Tax=Nicotiana tabacum TaxID=4097 RepID=A0A1S3Z2E0_TOBAC|nr:PREDICTED: myosin-1-like [Nicotiana tabacum]